MPYEWTAPETLPRRLSLWPHRSLLRKDFVHFMGATAALAALPIVTMLGTPILWMLLMPFAAMFALLWWALRRSDKDGEIVEELTLTPDHAHLIRHNPRGNKQEWEANPYWTSVHLHPKGGPVENYLTLRGNGREVEIGAFLSPEERVALYDDLQGALAKLPR